MLRREYSLLRASTSPGPPRGVFNSHLEMHRQIRTPSLFRLILVIGALHVAILSIGFGARHVGYVLAATLRPSDALYPDVTVRNHDRMREHPCPIPRNLEPL